MSNILKRYRIFLKQNQDPLRAEKAKKYLYSDLVHYGIPTGKRRAHLKKYRSKLKNLSKKTALELAQKFWDQDSFEEKSFALEIVELHKQKMNKSDLTWIEKWARECKGWALLDGFIIPVMPEILAKDKSAYKILEEWIKDDDFWIRRSALLAQLLLFREGINKGSRNLFFRLAKSQFNEDWIDKKYKNKLQNKRAKFFIRKAIGWTLREMSQKDPENVSKFLRENKDDMSGLSFREGSRKLEIKR
ncbi:MAG TPA: DNA alkylation repair protein [Candidatus Bathyarchaeia archaeon]|nr:DNA alkylation repair protein [Candidatus Bathyarchaeia archaeon]